MHRFCSLLLVVATLGAAQAAPDPLLFIRDGKVMLLPANAETPQQVIADDPGWTYASPTWLNEDQAVVLRLKGGQAGHSLVGIIPSLKTLPLQPTQLKWLNAAAGCHSLGVRASDRHIGFTRVAPKGEAGLELFLTMISADGVPGTARSVYSDETGDVGGPPRRLQFALEGNGAAVPVFPSDASSIVQVFDPTVGKLLSPKWLDFHWLREQKADEAVTAVAWLPGHKVAIGTRTRGIWLYDDAAQSLKAWDTWDAAGAVTEISLSADGQRIYYAYDAPGTGGESGSEIRSLDPNGNHTVVLRHASDPAVLPAAG